MGTVILRRMKPRRRRAGLTDYRKRLKLVKSGLERLVVRRTNRRIIAMLVKSKAGGDETLVSATSDVLSKFGWKASFKSIPAAYLTGFLLGKKALENGIEKAIVDFGVHRSVKGSRLYAVVKGVLDAGVEVPVDEEMLVPEERLYGEHISNYFRQVSQNPASPQFRKTDPAFVENIRDMVISIKEKIAGGAGVE
jgi:large subunit ribosomal protein L18